MCYEMLYGSGDNSLAKDKAVEKLEQRGPVEVEIVM